MKKQSRILYLSHDGMTDALGQSQVIAYLKRLNRLGFDIDIISFEKPEVYSKKKEIILDELKTTTINWYPLAYTNKVPLLSTLQLLNTGWNKIKELHAQQPYDIVHCRAQMMAVLGNRMKTIYGVKFIFDMRGWWTDEKFENGGWNKPLFKPLYPYLKGLERKYFKNADYVVSLTHVGKEEIVNHNWAPEKKVGVIPTCVDFNVFKSFDEQIRKEIRVKLSIPEDAFVLIYSGSLGGAYNVGDIFRIYEACLQVKPNAYLLLLAKSVQDNVLEEIAAFNKQVNNRVVLTSADFKQVHQYLIASDLGIILYEKTYSVIGRSPTKLGEYWACGIAAVSPSGIGDVDYILNKYAGSGALISDLKSIASISEAIDQVLNVNVTKDQLREYSKSYYDLEKGIEFYKDVYLQLMNG